MGDRLIVTVFDTISYWERTRAENYGLCYNLLVLMGDRLIATVFGKPSGTHGRQAICNLASDFAFLVLMGDRLIVNTVFYACMSRSTIKFTLLPVLFIVRVIKGMSKSRE